MGNEKLTVTGVDTGWVGGFIVYVLLNQRGRNSKWCGGGIGYIAHFHIYFHFITNPPNAVESSSPIVNWHETVGDSGTLGHAVAQMSFLTAYAMAKAILFSPSSPISLRCWLGSDYEWQRRNANALTTTRVLDRSRNSGEIACVWRLITLHLQIMDLTSGSEVWISGSGVEAVQWPLGQRPSRFRYKL